jgi:hypothetical protein
VVFVPKYGIEGPVYLVPKDAANNQQQQYILDEEKQTVVSTDGRTRFTVFDKCAVRISVEEGASHRWALHLVHPPVQEHVNMYEAAIMHNVRGARPHWLHVLYIVGCSSSGCRSPDEDAGGCRSICTALLSCRSYSWTC